MGTWLRFRGGDSVSSGGGSGAAPRARNGPGTAAGVRAATGECRSARPRRSAAQPAGNRAAFYLQPSYVIHSNTYSTAGCFEHIEHGHDIPGCVDATTSGVESNTLLVGLSSRVRVSAGVYVLGSWTPRASGFRPGVSLKTFGIEKQLRGHVFQLNVSNSLGTTMAEMSRGASNHRDWFLGFNISRRFF